MNLRRLKHTLLRLSAQEKVIGISSIAMIIGTFLPWYNVVMIFDQKIITETALNGDLGVMGFVVLLMSILSLLYLVGENLHLPLPKVGYKREGILFFLLGQSAFLTLLIIAIYTKRSLEFTEASLRFGSYIVLVGAFFGAFSAFSLIQKSKQGERKTWVDEEEIEEESNLQNQEDVEDEMSQLREGDVEEKEDFYESNHNEDLNEEIENTFNDSPKLEEPTVEKFQEPKDQTSNKPQANYFTREAGIHSQEKSKIEEEEKKPSKSSSMNFYEDND